MDDLPPSSQSSPEDDIPRGLFSTLLNFIADHVRYITQHNPVGLAVTCEPKNTLLEHFNYSSSKVTREKYVAAWK